MSKFRLPDDLARDLRAASYEEREEVMPMLRALHIAHGRRVNGPRTAVGVARVAASPVPPPPDMNARVRQAVAARPSPAAETTPLPTRPSLLTKLRAAISPAPSALRSTRPQSRTAAGTGVPAPPSVNDRIKNGVW